MTRKDSKITIVQFRATDDDLMRLDWLADKYNTNRSNFIRQLVYSEYLKLTGKDKEQVVQVLDTFKNFAKELEKINKDFVGGKVK